VSAAGVGAVGAPQLVARSKATAGAIPRIGGILPVSGYAQWDMTQTRRALVASLLVVALGGTVFAKTKFKSVWRSPDAATMKVGGKKVAALVIDTEISLRMAGEEALANELTARGMQGVPAYRIVPKEELRDADKAKGWFERSDVEEVVKEAVKEMKKLSQRDPLNEAKGIRRSGSDKRHSVN